MSEIRQLELLAALWFIAAALCFQNNLAVVGFIFLIMGCANASQSIAEFLREKNQ